jgi:hypothetical protein
MANKVCAIAGLILLGCGSPDDAEPFRFPETISSDWTLSSQEEIDPEKTPQGVQDLGLVQAMRATYTGPETLTVVVYQMTTQSGAFELVQQWRPMPGSLALYVGANFIIVESPLLDNATLQMVAEELERQGGI